MGNREPTDRQTAIYEFIIDRLVTTYAAPTVREIQAHFGISSPNGVCCHLKALVKKGWLRHLAGGGVRRPYVPVRQQFCIFCGCDVPEHQHLPDPGA